MKKISIVFIKIINIILVVLPFIFVWLNNYALFEAERLWQATIILVAIYVISFFYISSSLDGLKFGIVQISDLFFGQIAAISVIDAIMFFLMWMLFVDIPNVLPLILCFLLQSVIILMYTILGNKIFFKIYPPQNAIVIYGERYGMEDIIDAYRLKVRYDVRASYPIDNIVTSNMNITDKSLDIIFDNVKIVFICGVHSHERNIILKYCVAHGIQIIILPKIGDVIMSGASRAHLLYLPLLSIHRYAPSVIYRILKRVFDIIVSGVMLIILSPIIFLISILIKLDGGPAFYKQVRLTKNGKEFKIIKFRSMCVDAEKTTGAILSAGENDPRITKIGKKLRACRLDELPQLWNIFVGDMSIVGPRPERPEIAKIIEETLPEFALRLQCKAGLTGYAQVYGKYNIDPYDKLLMDLMYISKASIIEDFTIMLATIKPLFKKDSTEGVGASEVELVFKEKEN